MSDAAVFRVTDGGGRERYIKVGSGATAADLREEVNRTTWLGKRNIRVPAILNTLDEPSLVALVMNAVPGCSPDALARSGSEVAETLGRAFLTLHTLLVPECPFDESLDVRLARARDAVCAGLVDPEAFEERNKDMAPEALLTRLFAQRPRAEDDVVVHGDATFDNVRIDADGTVGLIDCGRAGRADRYVDLALLAADILVQIGEEAVRAFALSYGQGPLNRAKLRYYGDLYELF